MAESPFLHVMLPVYGRVRYLSECLDSLKPLLASGVVSCTIVDDASPDDETSQLLSSVSGIEVIRNEVNLGIARNFQKCADLSKGRFTVFAGSDDLFLPRFLDEIQELDRVAPRAAILSPGVSVIDADGESATPLPDRVKNIISPRSQAERAVFDVEGDRGVARLLIGNYLYFPALAWRTDTLRAERFNADFSIALDLDLLLRVLFDGGTIAYRRDPKVFLYRRHGLSASQLSRHGEGNRYLEESRIHAWAYTRARSLGWNRSAIAAKIQLTSRMNAVAARASESLSQSGRRRAAHE